MIAAKRACKIDGKGFVCMALWVWLAPAAQAEYSFVRSFAPQGEGSTVVSMVADGYLHAATDGDFPYRTIQNFDRQGNYQGKNGAAEAPNSVATDGIGTIYLADGFGGGIYVAGTGTQINTNAPPTGGIFCIAADSVGDIWSSNPPGSISQYSSTGDYLGEFPIPGLTLLPGIGLSQYVTGMAADPSGSMLFVALASTGVGGGGDRILQLSPDGTVLNEFGGTGSGNGQLKLESLSGIALTPDMKLYVADTGNNRVQVFDALSGDYLTQFGSAGTGDGQFQSPRAIAADQFDVWVADLGNHRIQQFSQVPEPSSAVLLIVGACCLGVVRQRRRRSRKHLAGGA